MPATRCPHCTAALPDDEAVFCVGCGRRVEGWSKSPLASAGEVALVDGATPTRKAEIAPQADGAASRQRRRTPLEKTARAATKGRDLDPAATVRTVPPASSLATTDPGMAVAPEGESLATEMAALRARGPRLVQVMALAVASATLAAGGAFTLYRRLHPPVVVATAPRRPVTVNLDAPATAPPPRISLDRPVPARRRGRPAPLLGASPPAASRSTVAAPSVPATPSPQSAATAPRAVTPEASPAIAQDVRSPSPAAPPASSGSAPTAALAPAAAPPATAAEMPRDEVEEAPALTPGELAEQGQARAIADGIRFVLRSHRAQVETCYERAFKNEPSSPGGKLVVDFTVDKDGHARRIETSENTTGNSLLSRCLEERLAEWQFPRPPSGEFATSYPFVFSGG